MKRVMIFCWAAVLIVMAAACNRAPETGDEAQAIQDTEKQWNQDFAAKDADKLASYYADDAVMMAPGMAPSVGRESIRATLKAMVVDPALSLEFMAAKIGVSQSGDLGYTRGAYVMTMTDPLTKKVVNDHGSYVTTYRKDIHGDWKAVADIASSEVPPAEQAPTSTSLTPEHLWKRRRRGERQQREPETLETGYPASLSISNAPGCSAAFDLQPRRDDLNLTRQAQPLSGLDNPGFSAADPPGRSSSLVRTCIKGTGSDRRGVSRLSFSAGQANVPSRGGL